MIKRDQIAEMIPHGEGMSLLDEVSYWDQQKIQVRTGRHTCNANPLRSNDTVGSLILIEYAAQATAVHANLVGSGLNQQPHPVYLAAVKNLELHCREISTIQDGLELTAECLMQQAGGTVYTFSASSASKVLATGRLLLIHQASESTEQ